MRNRIHSRLVLGGNDGDFIGIKGIKKTGARKWEIELGEGEKGEEEEEKKKKKRREIELGEGGKEDEEEEKKKKKRRENDKKS